MTLRVRDFYLKLLYLVFDSRSHVLWTRLILPDHVNHKLFQREEFIHKMAECVEMGAGLEPTSPGHGLGVFMGQRSRVVWGGGRVIGGEVASGLHMRD
jgi:hypothetical protein